MVARRCYLLFILQLCALLQLSAQVATDQAPRQGRVTFDVVDHFGKAIPFKLLSFRSRGGIEFKDRFQGLSGSNLPYGSYSYSLDESDIEPTGMIRGDVRVSVPEKILRVVAVAGPIANPASSVEVTWPQNYRRPGRVEAMPVPGTNGRIRFQSLYRDESYEYQVSNKGEFSIWDILFGDFAVFIFQDNRLVCLKAVSFPGQSPDQLSRTELLIPRCRPVEMLTVPK
jgi:hypothetical protein